MLNQLLFLPRRYGRVVECDSLENYCTVMVPGVRIPLSPPFQEKGRVKEGKPHVCGAFCI